MNLSGAEESNSDIQNKYRTNTPIHSTIHLQYHIRIYQLDNSSFSFDNCINVDQHFIMWSANKNIYLVRIYPFDNPSLNFINRFLLPVECVSGCVWKKKTKKEKSGKIHVFANTNVVYCLNSFSTKKYMHCPWQAIFLCYCSISELSVIVIISLLIFSGWSSTYCRRYTCL